MAGRVDGAGGSSSVVAGLYPAIRAIAAAYRALDLWYTIRTASRAVLRGLLGWGGAIVAAAVLLGDRRTPFIAGLLGYLAFYLLLYALRPLLFRHPPPAG